MTNFLIKYSSPDCGLCHRMGLHDTRVAQELGLEFEQCYPQITPDDPNTILFKEYIAAIADTRPRSEECKDCDGPIYGWPTYLLVSKVGGSAVVRAKYQGAAPKAKFREILLELIKGLSNQDKSS